MGLNQNKVAQGPKYLKCRHNALKFSPNNRSKTKALWV